MSHWSMKRVCGFAAVALWIGVAAHAAPVSVSGTGGVSAETARKLQGIIDRVRDDALPGGVIVRVQSLKSGAVWQGANGPFAEEQEEDSIHPGDAFRIASITKSFTAAVIWRLAEDRKLSVDDPISRYLDPDIVGRIHVLNGVSSGSQITLRQLLCHCSGIWDYAVENKRMMRYIFAHPHHQWEPSQLIDIAIKEGKPYFKPGEGYHYSDTGYILLGQIIEKVTAKPLSQVYRELIYEPLGLRDTYLEGREPSVGPPRSHNYVGYLDETDFNPTLDAYSSGGQVSTTEDLARFISAVVGGQFFKNAATLQAAMAVPTFKSPPITAPNEDPKRFWTHFMFFSTVRDGMEFVGHSGYWGAVMFYQPERGVVITGTGNEVERRLPLAQIARAFAGH